MSRKPVDQLAAAPKPQGRQVIWDQLRHRDGLAITAAKIARNTDINPRTIRSYLDALVRAGAAEFDGERLYRLNDDAARRYGAEAPRVNRAGRPVTQGLGNEAIWRTLRAMRCCGLGELVMAASTPEVRVSATAARRYCRHLVAAGYLRQQQRDDGPAFALIRDTGPLPPQIQRTHRVWDGNLRQVVWPAAEGGR